MEPRLYKRLLLRLLGLPVAALTVLSLVLGYAFHRVEQSARLVDRSDLVIAGTNRLLKLMVDEETGLRGFLLTQDPVFLEPLRIADQKLDAQFAEVENLARRRPQQIERLERLHAAHQAWDRDARREIQTPPLPAEIDRLMLTRKQSMDDLRAQAGEFLRVEEDLRASRSRTALQISRVTWFSLFALAALVAVLLAWETRRLMDRLTGTFTRQIKEIQIKGEESDARRKWLNTTLRSIGDAVIACDAHARIVFMNPVAEELTGWGEAEAAGKLLHEVFPIFNEETRQPVENPVDKVLRLGTIVGLANHTFLQSRDGREISIDDSGAPISDADGNLIGIVLVFRDIMERRISEGALMRAEKLAAAGRLAASVAHEVNNPLEGLTNLIYLACHSDEVDEIRKLLSQAEGELGRVAHITRQSLGFYRETAASARFQPAKIAREVAEFYAYRASNLGVAIALDADTPVEILATAGELRQVLSNLLANSLDACTKGNVVRVKASAAVDPRAPSDRSRAGVRITVADTGAGIPPDYLPSVFEPFFTTKKDTGTGLGLWVSRELVEKHGGTLNVRSSTVPGRSGAVFSLFLPQSGSAPAIALLPG